MHAMSAKASRIMHSGIKQSHAHTTYAWLQLLQSYLAATFMLIIIVVVTVSIIIIIIIVIIVIVSCCICSSFFLVAGSVLHLLTVVFAGSETKSSPSLEQLMPRLWPLFRHPLARVRLAIVHCLQAFLTSHTQAQAWLTTPVLQAALRCKLNFDP